MDGFSTHLIGFCQMPGANRQPPNIRKAVLSSGKLWRRMLGSLADFKYFLSRSMSRSARFFVFNFQPMNGVAHLPTVLRADVLFSGINLPCRVMRHLWC